MTWIRKVVDTRALVSMVAVSTMLGLVVVPTLAALRGPGSSARPHYALASLTHVAAVTSCSAPCYNVLNYGANPNGVADNTAPFRAAIGAAQANASGGTVYVPPGTYAFTQILHGYSINIPTAPLGPLPPVTLEGGGPNASILVEHVGGQQLLGIENDRTQVEGLTLNARSYGGGADVTDAANNTTITQDSIMGAHKTGVIGGGSHAPFALYFPGPPGASQHSPLYNTGNTVSDTTIEDGINNDGFSYSFQSNGTLSNIHHFGSRVSLFVDKGVTMTNYSYTPNPECLGAQNGYYITGPSSNITITNFTTSGAGGVINGPTATNFVTNVTIDNERFTSPSGFHMDVGDVTGLTIKNSSFNTGNNLLFTPNIDAGDSGINVENTTIPLVQIARFMRSTYRSLSVAFNNDTFPGATKPTFTSPLPAPGTTAFSINGGKWSNLGGGFYSGSTPNITYNVTNLAPIPVGLPTITGTPKVGNPLTTSNGTWLAGQTPLPTFTYQWELGGTAIANATSSSYTPSVSGSYSVVVTAKNTTGTTPITSPAITVTS